MSSNAERIEAIASALANNNTEAPGFRQKRRREQLAASYEPDLEEMERLLREDPDRFDRTFGPRGRITVGMNQAARAAGEGAA